MRPQRHLAAVVNQVGTPSGTAHVLPIIAEGLKRLREAEKQRRIIARGSDKKNNPSVSDAGKCERKVVLSLLNIAETNPPDTDSELRFLVGHAFEEAIAQILEAHQGATYLREERVEIIHNGVPVTGRKDFDAVRVLAEEAVWELKGVNPRSLSWLLKRGTPNEDHIAQLNLYLHATGRVLGYLIYFAMGSTKGEPNLHAWRIEYDKTRALADLDILAELDGRAKTNSVPPVILVEDKKKGGKKVAGAYDFPCSYCGFRDLCHGGDLTAALTASLELRRGIA